MNRRFIIIMAALLISSLALPLTLHELDLRHIRDSTFSAVRFAVIADPSQLSQLPVSRWEETDGVATPSVRRMTWGRYELRIPRATTTVVADVDLRPTFAALLLGAGGWLRVAAAFMVGAVLLCLGLRRSPSGTKKTPHSSIADRSRPQGAMHTHTPISLLKAGLDRVAHPALLLDRDHRLVVWNAVIQKDSPKTVWSPDLHLLDLSTLLPWGKQLIEAVDDHALHVDSDSSGLILIVNEGGRICITAG